MKNLKILIKWLMFYTAGLYFSKYIPEVIIYFLCLSGFLTGFLLRLFKKYPGEDEPLILDFSTFLLSAVILYILIIYKNINFSGGFILIFLPHIIYNLIKIFFPFI